MADPIIDDGVPEGVARQLQDGLDKLNELKPAHYDPPPFLANYRHLCTKARQAAHTGKGVSTAIDLKEQYVTSWEKTADSHDDEQVISISGKQDPDDEYAILYREGSCKSCGEVARSKKGRVVLTSERPPVYGRVGRD